MAVASPANYDFPSGAMLIDGDWVVRSGHGRRQHINPATGKVQADFVLAGEIDIKHAVGAARRALVGWRATPAHTRRDLLLRLAALIAEHDEEFGVLAARESGRLFARGSTFLASQYFSYYAGWADKHRGITHRSHENATFDYTLLEPRGVIAVIIPWNGPLSSIGMKVAAALAAGNTVVLKPPELAPFAALRFGELCVEAGLPAGVVNVVPGGADAGETLVRHPGVGAITFTGGLSTARRVMEGAAEHLTPVLLELGGKSASVVFDDADLPRAGQLAAILALQVNAGQGCCLPTRLFVQRAAYDEVVDRVVATAQALRPGDPLLPGTTMGPVISGQACDRILGIVEVSRRENHGVLLTGGHRVGGELADGFFLQPTIFGDVDNGSPLAQEEIFGPVLAISPFDTEDEAVCKANDSDFGLGAYVYTNDLARAHRVAAALDSGMVSVNGMSPMLPTMPFGGIKSSGFGREGGREGLEEFLRPKHITLSLH